MRILVTGGRDYKNRTLVHATLENYPYISLLVEGGAQGADRLAREWALHRKVPQRTFHADWKQHGKSAGPKRNQQMLDETKPDLVIAFPGGAGTADMVRRAEVANIKVLRVTEK